MLTMRIIEDSNVTGRLCFPASGMRSTARLGATVIDITPTFSPEREKVEAFIRNIYAKTYQADIDIHYPTLMSVRTADGTILSAIGFRFAEQEPLFLEHYTGAPIEQCLTQQYGKPIARTGIAEIGNLASVGNGASMYLFAALSAYLKARHIQYATITGTRMLQERLRKWGLEPRSICPADATLLDANERARWGSYYAQDPQVLSGSVEEGVHHLESALGMLYEERPSQLLFPRLHCKANA